MRNIYVLIFILIVFSKEINAQIFVKQTATGNNDGTTWNNAFTDLQDALAIATAGSEIWVAKGLYKPVTCEGDCSQNEKSVAFVVLDGVKIYGGFAGNENQLEDRNWELNKSILSGDIGVGGDNLDNSLYVVKMENVTQNTILDGLVIQDGYQSDNNFSVFGGAGIYVYSTDGNTGNASPRVENCLIRNNIGKSRGSIRFLISSGATAMPVFKNTIFENNQAQGGTATGGAVDISSLRGAHNLTQFIDCQFRNNVSGSGGGAISFNVSNTFSEDDGDHGLFIDNCLFENNSSVGTFPKGGAIHISGFSTDGINNVIKDSKFINNFSNESGGALSIQGGLEASSIRNEIINCLFSGNVSLNKAINGSIGGGAAYIFDGSAENNNKFINCIFHKNRSKTSGGAIYSFASYPELGNPNVEIVNCTFAGNEAELEGDGVYVTNFNATNNVYIANSIFADENSSDGDDEISRNAGIVAINNSIITAGIPVDVTDNGNNQVVDPLIFDADNGDFHIQSYSPAVNAGDNGAVPDNISNDYDGNLRIRHEIVDIGAFETGAIYVDQNATGNNNGQSWEDAFTDLQSALSNTQRNKEIWVARGTYLPNTCAGECTVEERQVSFFVADSVELYGGFNATEISRDQRDWENNPTILSGDIGIPNDSVDNTYSVVKMGQVGETTVLDGFIIEHGHADGSFDEGHTGGGINVETPFNEDFVMKLKLSNTIIRNNFAGGGGGLYIHVSRKEVSPTFNNVIFENNSASLFNVTSSGGAILMSGVSVSTANPIFKHCIFRNNLSGNSGGAISISLSNSGDITALSSIVIDSCLFENNIAMNGFGGALYVRTILNYYSEHKISNVQFINNQAGNFGGAVYDRTSFSGGISNNEYINCLFLNNSSQTDGGAVYFLGRQEATNSSRIVNSVFTNNSALLRGGAVFNEGTLNGSAANLGLCITQLINNTFTGNTAGEGTSVFNDFAEPLFYNNIFWNSGDEIGNEDSTPTLINNIIQGGYNGTGNQTNTITDDPAFIDLENGNYNLSPCSPGVNSGENEIVQTHSVETDFEGKARIFDDIVDIGAFEWNGEPARLDSIAFETQAPSYIDICDGAITATPFNGIPDYTYNWSNGETTATIFDLCEDTYILTVTDSQGCQFTDSVFLEAIPNTIPVFTSDSIVTAIEDELFTYNITTEDPDDDETLVISVETLPDWLEIVDNGDGTAVLSGTPTNEDVGIYAIVLNVTDSKGASNTQAFDLEVINVNDPPEIVSEPDTLITVGNEYIYNILAEDEDVGDIITLSMGFAPSWLIFVDNGDGTGSLSGIPALTDAGSYNLTIIASDAAGAIVTQEFQLIVIDDNNPPEFASIPDTTATIGVNYAYTVTAIDQDAEDVLVFSIPFLPAWLSFTDNGDGTALLEGEPQPNNVGSFSIQIFVSDPSGAEATQEFDIAVIDPNLENSPPKISNINLETNEDQSVAITKINFSDQYTDNENDEIKDIFIETLPLNGTLSLNGNPLSQPTSFSSKIDFELVYTPNENFNGTDQWLWNANDGNFKSLEAAVINIDVLPVNDPPTNLTLSNNVVMDNAVLGDVVGEFNVEDIDFDDSHIFYFSANNNADADFFSIEGDQLLVNKTLDFAAQSSYVIEVIAEDQADEIFIAEFKIIIEPRPVVINQNGITPNGDGINDVWIVPDLVNCQQCKVEIYNRWGQKVFTSQGYSQPWNGRYQEKILPTGTYYYLIDYGDDTLTKTGTVTILK